MNYILQQPKIDLGNTSIENIFITDYMPLANGTYVKVYLLGYKYACDNNSNFNNQTISKHLKIPLSDVLSAWDFWEQEGLIKKHETDDKYNFLVEFINLKQLYIDNIYKHISGTGTSSNNYTEVDELITLNKSTDIKKMFAEIENVFGRPFTPNEKRKLIDWLKNYKMKPEVLIQAFSYCVNKKNIRSFNYIEKVVASWHDAGVINIDTLSSYLEKRNDRFYVYSRISKTLGFNYRPLTEEEMKTIDKWLDEWKFSIDMVMKCLQNSVKTSNPNINYFNSILENWNKKGYKTPNDIKKDKRAVQKKVKVQNKNKFHNFDQKTNKYSAEELDKIGRRNFEKKMKELEMDLTEG